MFCNLASLEGRIYSRLASEHAEPASSNSNQGIVARSRLGGVALPQQSLTISSFDMVLDWLEMGYLTIMAGQYI